ARNRKLESTTKTGKGRRQTADSKASFSSAAGMVHHDRQKPRSTMTDLLPKEDWPLHFPDAPARYRIERLCGQGAAGSVYRAWDHELGRAVALKFLRDHRPAPRAPLLRQARAPAPLAHPQA